MVTEKSESVFALNELFLKVENGLRFTFVDVSHLFHQFLSVDRSGQSFVRNLTILINQPESSKKRILPLLFM